MCWTVSVFASPRFKREPTILGPGFQWGVQELPRQDLDGLELGGIVEWTPAGDATASDSWNCQLLNLWRMQVLEVMTAASP